jgi:hypothetical protein
VRWHYHGSVWATQLQKVLHEGVCLSYSIDLALATLVHNLHTVNPCVNHDQSVVFDTDFVKVPQQIVPPALLAIGLCASLLAAPPAPQSRATPVDLPRQSLCKHKQEIRNHWLPLKLYR